jgi:SSS family solute:Na+ symporter
MMDVFKQLQLTWIIPVLFAAPFWVGMWWRRATTSAAWLTILYCALVFFIIPKVAPKVIDGLDARPEYAITNNVVTTVTTRKAAPSDVARGKAAIELWNRDKAALEKENKPLDNLGPQPKPVDLGQEIVESKTGGGKAIFWTKIEAIDDTGKVITPQLEEISRVTEGNTTTITKKHVSKLRGKGEFKLDFLLYQWFGMDLTDRTDATLSTLELPPKIITPFLVMIVLSLITPRNRKESLDRYYVKMKTPVLPDPQDDALELEVSYNSPDRFEKKKMFPGTDVEINMPTFADAFGFVVCFAICFGVIYLAVWAAGIGG